MKRLTLNVLLALFVAACAASSSSAVGTEDGGSSTGDGGSDARSAGDTGTGNDAGGNDAAAGPVAVANLSYVNDAGNQLTSVTFVLRNDSAESIAKIRSVKLHFSGTEVASWGDLSTCKEWAVPPGGKSSILTMKVYTYVNDAPGMAKVTCNEIVENGQRPLATREAIGKGVVTVAINGVLADATPFVAKADATGP